MNKKTKIKYIDLFCGIGGFRLGLNPNLFSCVFSCDNNIHAQKMYELNFNDLPFGDIRNIEVDSIPDHDLLVAGFPCQTFSISGKQKGFLDETRGTLFFEILRVIKNKKPKVIFLENVKNLVLHNKGKTLKIILDSLILEGYCVTYKILNASDFGVPQNRERIIIIANKGNTIFDFEKIKFTKSNNLKSILEKKGDFEFLDQTEFTLLKNKKIQKSGLIFSGYRNKEIRKKGAKENTQHLSRVHKQPNRIYSVNGYHPTLSSQESAGRYFIEDNTKVRKLTLNECYKVMGFPDDFKKIGSKGKLYQRIGNSVCVPMVRSLSNEIYKQFFNGENKIVVKDSHIINELENIYNKAIKKNNKDEFNLEEKIINFLECIVKYEETNKGVFTVLITSIIYKIFFPSQDIRIHQANLPNGYSGRSFDTQYVTPFLKSKNFLGAMAESGWLTRSLEQNKPYNFDYPGKITPFLVKDSFLNLLDFVEKNPEKSVDVISYLFFASNSAKKNKMITIVNPIIKVDKVNISTIIDLLKKHFYYRYSNRGASILPVIAIYSIYECLINQTIRYKNKKLLRLMSHTSSDKSSKLIGDVNVVDEVNEIFESVEVKFEISISSEIVNWCYKKIKNTKVQRFYILSTKLPNEIEINKINLLIEQISKEHGCQLIVNGLIDSLKYYLRLIDNTNEFLEKYIKNLQNNNEINYEHKIAWNNIIKNVF